MFLTSQHPSACNFIEIVRGNSVLLHMKLKGLIYDDDDDEVPVQVQCSSQITSTV